MTLTAFKPPMWNHLANSVQNHDEVMFRVCSFFSKHDFYLFMDSKNHVWIHPQNCLMLRYILNIDLVIFHIIQLCICYMLSVCYCFISHGQLIAGTSSKYRKVITRLSCIRILNDTKASELRESAFWHQFVHLDTILHKSKPDQVGW